MPVPADGNGSVTIFDFPGLEGFEAHISVDALCSSYLAERLRLLVLQLMLPPPPESTRGDEALGFIFTRWEGREADCVRVEDIEDCFMLLHATLRQERELAPVEGHQEGQRQGLSGSLLQGMLKQKLASSEVMPSGARRSVKPSVFIVNHHSCEVKYDSESWLQDARRRVPRRKE